MSYGLYKYIEAKELSGSSDVTYRIELLKNGYSGASEQLEGAENYFEHIYNKINPRNPFENPVQSSQLDMIIHVQGQDELDLLEEIFGGDEDAYILQKKIDGSVVWQGKVLNDLLEYDEGDYPFPGRIIAKDLSYLKGVEYPLEENDEKIITTLAGALNELGFGLDIYTYTNWVENNQSDTSDDFLNNVYNDTYAFRNYGSSTEQGDTTISQYDVIDIICRNYNLILRQSNNAWHLFHISALDNPASVKRYSYDSAGAPNSPASSTEDLTISVDSTDLYVLPFSGNKINPAVKKASIVFEHRSGTTQTLVNASRISGTTDPGLPVAKYSVPFQSAGDEIVELSGRNYAVTGRAYYQGNSDLPQASYLLKAGQYYWNNDASDWQEYSDITTSQSAISPAEIDTANNKIRIVSNDFAHGDVIRVDEDLTTGTDADTEYYLIDVSGTVETGSNTLYYQLSEEPDGTPVSLGSKTASSHNIYRVSNREQMVTTTPLAFNSTVWWYDFNIITTEIPADADGDVEFYAMGAVMPPQDFVIVNSHYWEYASPTNFWQDTLVLLKDPTTANGDSITYELEQSGNYSTLLSYPEVYFGDGPLDYSRSALLVTDVSTADTSTSQWDFVGGSSNSNFFEIWLKEVLNVQRTARRNLRAELYGEFEAYQVLSHDSKYFFFLGGTQRGRGNRWDADFFEIDIETGSDTFTTIINAQNSAGTGGSGGGTNASIEGISVDFADSRYLQISNDLSDVDDASSARTNLGLGSGDSPTFAGLTVDGLVVEDEVRTLQSDVIENHLEIESLQDNKVEKGQLFPDGDEQALGTGDAVTFSTVDTGQGANELYAMDQDVQQADSPTFNRVILSSQADDGTKAVRADREVSAGDGVTGGGDLTADRTITLGTPSTTTVGGSNAVTTDSHTHALDLSGRSITLSDDSDGVLTFDTNTQNLGADRTYTPTIADHASGQRGVLNDGTSAQTIYGDKTFDGALTADDSILLDDTAKFESEAGYVSGFTGSGFNLSRVSSLWRLELDDMYIRGALFASELIINQISAINGSDILSPGRGKVEEISGSDYTVSDPQGGNYASFAVNDIVIVQQVRPDNNSIVKRIVRKVTAVTGNVISLATATSPPISAPSDSGSIEVGDIIVAIGNTSDTDRQANIFRTVTDSDSPYVRVNDGITSWADWTGVDKLKLQYGNLDSLTSTYSNVSGYGFFSENTYLTNEILVGDLSKSANYLEYNVTDGLVIKVGDDDLSTAIAEIRSDLIDIYLADQSTFAGIQFLSGQITLKVGADGKVASARLDATGDESAITLRADYFDFQSNDIVLIGDPDQDAGTEAKIALGSNVDTITVTNTDSGFIATGAGEFKGYIDASNYIRLGSSSLDINAELFNLTTGDIRLTNNYSSQNSDYTSSVTYSDTLQFAGLFFDSDNYLGHITDVDTSANSGYLFRVGGTTSNFIEVNEAGGIGKINFDTFILDATDASGGIKIDSDNELIQLEDANHVRTQIDVTNGSPSISVSTLASIGATIIDTSTPYETTTGTYYAVNEGNAVEVFIEAELTNVTNCTGGTFTIEIYGGNSTTSATNLLTSKLSPIVTGTGNFTSLYATAYTYDYAYYKVKVTVAIDNPSGAPTDAEFTTATFTVKEYESQTRLALDGIFVNNDSQQYARLTRDRNTLGGVTVLANLPTSDPNITGALYRDGTTIKISI